MSLTYYGQTARIDQLVEKYGAYLEKLNAEIKLLLRIILSTYVFKCELVEYSITKTLEDCTLIIPESNSQDLNDICIQLEGLTVDEAESILDALQYQLHWGNAQKIMN
ncbi:hypothetical protein H6G36_27570 [Anabaena minutissima FACHB-250]|nr:hypothetical protein [Anabaena minutissima FACHB-250]